MKKTNIKRCIFVITYTKLLNIFYTILYSKKEQIINLFLKSKINRKKFFLVKISEYARKNRYNNFLNIVIIYGYKLLLLFRTLNPPSQKNTFQVSARISEEFDFSRSIRNPLQARKLLWRLRLIKICR